MIGLLIGLALGGLAGATILGDAILGCSLGCAAWASTLFIAR